jgi:hypothetical protein
MVETACMDRGVVTNTHSKHAVKKPNGLLEGHWEDIDVTKKQNNERALFLAKSSKTTHLTPMCEGDAFGDLHKINLRTDSLGLIH